MTECLAMCVCQTVGVSLALVGVGLLSQSPKLFMGVTA